MAAHRIVAVGHTAAEEAGHIAVVEVVRTVVEKAGHTVAEALGRCIAAEEEEEIDLNADPSADPV